MTEILSQNFCNGNSVTSQRCHKRAPILCTCAKWRSGLPTAFPFPPSTTEGAETRLRGARKDDCERGTSCLPSTSRPQIICRLLRVGELWPDRAKRILSLATFRAARMGVSAPSVVETGIRAAPRPRKPPKPALRGTTRLNRRARHSQAVPARRLRGSRGREAECPSSARLPADAASAGCPRGSDWDRRRDGCARR